MSPNMWGRGKKNSSDKRANRSRELISFHKQQAKLIKCMAGAQDRIPKDLDQFEEFINELVDWHPPRNVIFTVWNKMCAAEEKVSGQKVPAPVITLSDEEGDDCVIISEDPPVLLNEAPIILHGSPKDNGTSLEDPFVVPDDCRQSPQDSLLVSHRIQDDCAIIEGDLRAIPDDNIQILNDCIVDLDGCAKNPETSFFHGDTMISGPLAGSNDPLEISEDFRGSGVLSGDCGKNSGIITSSINTRPKTKKRSRQKTEDNLKTLYEATFKRLQYTLDEYGSFKSNKQLLQTEDLAKEEKMQHRKKNGKPTCAVRPMNMVSVNPRSVFGKSQSAKRKGNPPKESQPNANKRTKKEKPMTDEETAALRQRLLIDKVIELELPKLIEAQTGIPAIRDPIFRQHLINVLRS